MRFVIIASRRTGSSHLVNTLSGHPEIFCHGNIFGSHMMPVFWPKGQRKPKEIEPIKAELRELRDEDPQGFLDRVYALGHGKPHVGFKIFRGQNNRILETLIEAPSVRKLVLYRGNVLASYSSDVAAKNTGSWGAREGHEKPPAPKVKFSEDEFVAYYNENARWYSRIIRDLLSHREPFHLIRYEEINDPLFLRTIVNFIGADPNRPIEASEQPKRQVKQNSSDIVSRFSDQDDVRQFLSRHSLLSWAHEGELSLTTRWDDQADEHAGGALNGSGEMVCDDRAGNSC
jgi:hypothetical protein